MRERWIWDREAKEVVCAQEYRARQEKRAAEKRFEFREVKTLRRGTYLWRNGRWVHAAKLRRKAQARSGINVIRDIEPYRAMSADVGKGGKRPIIGSRSEHRDFLRRNGYTEIGNDYVAPRREELSQRDRVADIKRSMVQRGID